MPPRTAHVLFALALGCARPRAGSETVCVQLETSYDDVGGSDDFYPDNDPRPARGVYLVVTDVDGATVYADYTPSGGDEAGCAAGIDLSDAGPYSVQIQSRARIGENDIIVYKSTEERTPRSSSIQDIDPGPGETVTLSWGPHRVWNVLSAAGWALHRRDAGLSGQTFAFYNEACPGGGNCYRSSEDALYIADDQNRFAIAHEMGHKVAAASNGGKAAKFDYGADSTDCPWDRSGHSITSEEYQSAAVNEGIASYYSAVVWNRDTEEDCWYKAAYKMDWDQDGVGDSAAEFSCEDGSPFGVADVDFMGTYCLDSGPTTNRGTQYDWIRFLWDLDTDQGLSTAQIFAIWDAADPQRWEPSGAGSGPGFPAWELQDAAARLGFGAAWDAQLAEDPSGGR